jgi:hypothetical protein
MLCIARRILIKWLVATFTIISCTVPVAQAAMIGTDQVIKQQQAQVDRERLAQLLERQELREQFVAMGVDPQEVQARVDALSDEEVATLNQQMDQLPAGSGVLGTVVFVFLVLLATDILGYTNIFPFVKKTVN